MNPDRPGSAISIICRPASSLSQYRPGTGYEGVLPDTNDGTKARPSSRMSVCSVDSLSSTSSSRRSVRPTSRMSVCSVDSLSSTSSSRRSVRPTSRMSVCSVESVSPTTSSRRSVRPTSRMSVCSVDSMSSTTSGSSVNRPASSTSNRTAKQRRRSSSVKSVSSIGSKRSEKTPSERCNGTTRHPNGNDVLPPKSKQLDDFNNRRRIFEKTKSTIENYNDELCYWCNIRVNRLNYVDKLKPLSTNNSKDEFMKGDNPMNSQYSSETIINRKKLLKEIANYNYLSAKKLNDEKKKLLLEKRANDCNTNKSSENVSNSFWRKMDSKHLLSNQTKCNEFKNEVDELTLKKNEILAHNELLKSLYHERLRNIEAKRRSQDNYRILLDENANNEKRICEEIKNESVTAVLGINQVEPYNNDKSNKCKKRGKTVNCREPKQQITCVRASREQKHKEIDGSENWSSDKNVHTKNCDEAFRRQMIQKKLNRKQTLLPGDLNELLAVEELKCDKNQMPPRAHPMVFPLRKMAKRCRLCKKNRLGIPAEKISELPC